MIVFCGILLILLLFWEIIYVLLFYNFTFKIKDGLSRNPSNQPLFFLIFRIFLTIFYIILDQNLEKNYNISLVMHLVFGIVLLGDSLINFPYHDKYVAKVNGSFTGVYLWINLSLLILNQIGIELLHEYILIILGLGLLFFVKLYLNIRNYTLKVLLLSDLSEIKNDIHLDLKIRSYNLLSKTSNSLKKSELVLASLLKIHFDKCKDSDCPCKVFYLFKKTISNFLLNRISKKKINK